MSPADGLIRPPEKTIGLGVPRFVWLKALKISVRNCMFTFSVIAVLFTSERSTLARPAGLLFWILLFCGVSTFARIQQ